MKSLLWGKRKEVASTLPGSAELSLLGRGISRSFSSGSWRDLRYLPLEVASRFKFVGYDKSDCLLREHTGLFYCLVTLLFLKAARFVMQSCPLCAAGAAQPFLCPAPDK